MKFLRPQGFSGPRDFFYKITTNKNNFNCKVSQTCLAKKEIPKTPSIFGGRPCGQSHSETSFRDRLQENFILKQYYFHF